MEEKKWLQHYDPGVPHTLQPYPNRTFVDIVAETAQQRPNHTALYFKGRTMSYHDLEWLSNSFAAALVGLGIKKGDRVALVLPNSPQAIIGQQGQPEGQLPCQARRGMRRWVGRLIACLADRSEASS